MFRNPKLNKENLLLNVVVGNIITDIVTQAQHRLSYIIKQSAPLIGSIYHRPSSLPADR